MSRKLEYLEKKVERKLTEGVKVLGGLALKKNAQSFKNVPDRDIYLPGGFYCMVETKRPGEVPRPGQQHTIDRFREMGFTVHVVDSVEAVESLLQEFKKIVLCNGRLTTISNSQ